VIRVQTEGGVRTITIDRAEKRNALTPTMLDQIAAGFAREDDARAVLLRGEGRVFCAGFDLDRCKDDPAEECTKCRAEPHRLHEKRDRKDDQQGCSHKELSETDTRDQTQSRYDKVSSCHHNDTD